MESVRLLLSHGAEVNIGGGRYGTALQAACVNEHLYLKRRYNLACLLIDDGADAAWDCSKDCMEGDIEDRIAFLLEYGANINLGAGLYGFPLQSACLAPTSFSFHLNTDGLIYLLDNCANINVNRTGGLFGTALQAAAYIGKTECVKLLLEKGADVNLLGGKWRSALNAAAVKGYWDLVEILLKAGAEADCTCSLELMRNGWKELGRKVGAVLWNGIGTFGR
ncbi:uncharacterized protein FMAN_09658 [Fusarium mangiferae]|uniref:Uncharacterized protein n=1 Tax=Fusarium mangiferae TaxID=192010 RepID=A0A1L7UC86_FUSMA|nr:uncharacterized protein FMAN_09658 [Fusarium mangiferae]CVL08019.1 uncharacterized protein FMAN_09658 [Fusarium mangiferae]